MPELPEVETIKRDLERKVKGRRIEKVKIFEPRLVRKPGLKRFKKMVEKRRIESIQRRGKYLIFDLNSDTKMVIHLKMSGALLLTPLELGYGRHTRAVFFLDDGQQLLFDDTRKFGELYAVSKLSDVPGLFKLGPEPLKRNFSLKSFRALLSDRNAKIKPLLLDQSFLAGLGNIYVNEVLHRAEIHPERIAKTLNQDEIIRLHRSIKRVLKEAIQGRGTSIDRFYRDASGKPGFFREKLEVYGREGEECLSCGSVIERSNLGGRGTFFCPQCQNIDFYHKEHKVHKDKSLC